MNYGFIIDNRKCIGCHACTVACKSEHDVPIGVNRTWVKYIEHGEFPDSQRFFSVMRCNHCDDAPCTTICPVTALYRRDDGIIDFDNDRCIGCKACTQACPYDALYIDPNTKTAAKCNYCTHRIDQGIEPACVVVCPEHAIISGDMDNPKTEISQMLAENKFEVRKPEKGTKPKVFYLNAQPASLTPTASAKEATYQWGSQGEGVGHNVNKGTEGLGEFKESVRSGIQSVTGFKDFKPGTKTTYDAPEKGILWGWEVPAYLMTKGIAAGVYLVHLILWFMGYREAELLMTVCAISLFFLAATGVLLILDMDRPDRFLNVLFRPQWNSWLVKGAYTIVGFGSLLCLNILAASFGSEGMTSGIILATGPFALMTGIYTAFLFAQAKGRDYWQSPLLPFHMLSHVLMLGASMLIIIGSVNHTLLNGYFSILALSDVSKLLYLLLMIPTAITLVLQIAEPFIKHSTRDAQLAARMMFKGRYKLHYWVGSVLMGCVIPLAILVAAQGSALLLLTFLIILGVWTSNHLIVKVPQLIPLS